MKAKPECQHLLQSLSGTLENAARWKKGEEHHTFGSLRLTVVIQHSRLKCILEVNLLATQVGNGCSVQRHRAMGDHSPTQHSRLPALCFSFSIPAIVLDFFELFSPGSLVSFDCFSDLFPSPIFSSFLHNFLTSSYLHDCYSLSQELCFNQLPRKAVGSP